MRAVMEFRNDKPECSHLTTIKGVDIRRQPPAEVNTDTTSSVDISLSVRMIIITDWAKQEMRQNLVE